MVSVIAVLSQQRFSQNLVRVNCHITRAHTHEQSLQLQWLDSGIISSSIAQTDFVNRFGNGTLADNTAGGIVSSFTGGAIVSSLFLNVLSDKYGRRAAIFLGALLACLGGALQGGANNVATIIVGRVIAGLAIGLLSATIPNYCSEVAPPKFRALLAGLQQWNIGLGFVCAQWIGYGSSLVHGPFSWRFPLSFQVLPALVLAAGIWFLPESPRFLAERGDTLHAHAILERLHRNHELVEAEYRRIQDNLEAEQKSRMGWLDMFRESRLRRRVLLACGIQLFTITSGINVINYYGPRIYSYLHFSTTRSLMIIGIYGALAQVYNTICIAFVDRVGRRKLLIPSMIGMGAALCVNATLSHFYIDGNQDPSRNENALRACVAMYFVFSVFFTSLGCISWIFSSEVFPTAIRAKGTSLSTFTNWAVNLIFAQCSPIALSGMGYRYFYIFTAFNWVAAAVVYFFYPETQGHTLETVNELFGDLQLRSSADSTGNVTFAAAMNEDKVVGEEQTPPTRSDPLSESMKAFESTGGRPCSQQIDPA
ncbi:uncharacterized protein Z519_03482 [Cladophialophora bantiana CBS 173.52]|uniref:Major facilitator superfamily (MFS) profile domain-containing protein n=1 Tax=Cladophialophora bantiana (strain ATCC 10958 / CBS 173.52 / CDC B-1940 / NIH 8579) TaxID=1442370 RepID=A0A0D2HSG2_CLAB1|nr:uncharacterized protein Z519_03482 [Cladophialophora bantiana CBS 173.52]KIW96413.1 hypothetical protein Z519_03482 [Cladophialophora bantiana CBS 173.52]